MLASVETLFLGCCNDASVYNECSGGIVKYAVDSEYNHVVTHSGVRVFFPRSENLNA
jgi:hypothetical protein